jgi:hypothetical protein
MLSSHQFGKLIIDHAIVLTSSAKPISRTPYWVFFVDYEELEQQWSDLINKGYIEHSKSLWGAPNIITKEGWDFKTLCGL